MNHAPPTDNCSLHWTHCHICVGPDEGLCEGGKQLYTHSKVTELDLSVGVDQHVGGLDVCTGKVEQVRRSVML